MGRGGKGGRKSAGLPSSQNISITSGWLARAATGPSPQPAPAHDGLEIQNHPMCLWSPPHPPSRNPKCNSGILQRRLRTSERKSQPPKLSSCPLRHPPTPTTGFTVPQPSQAQFPSLSLCVSCSHCPEVLLPTLHVLSALCIL